MLTATTTATIDRTGLEDIRQVLNTGALVRLAEIYADTAPVLCARIRAAEQSGHVMEMMHAAHSLKGGSLQICATHVAELACLIETACIEGRPADAHTPIAELSEMLARTLRDLAAAVVAPAGAV